jgi:hypothetical protein
MPPGRRTTTGWSVRLDDRTVLDKMRAATWCRAVLLVVVLVSAALLANGYTGYEQTTIGQAEQATDRPLDARQPVVPATDGVTVVTARGFEDHDRSAALLAFDPDGRPLYFDNSLVAYWDVETVPGSDGTVVYTGRTERDGETVNVVERLDLRSGEVDRLYAATGRGEWRSVAPINDTHVAVGDADSGRVFVLNATSGTVGWEWIAQAYVGSHGRIHHQQDGIRLNEVTATPDGRLVVNLHVRDQAVFVRPGEGIAPAWTVGRQMHHDRLYHQHAVDYIAAEHGGPSTVFADAGNDRLVEYQWTDGRWERTWRWRVPRLDNPADVDRLSGGRTLVTNTGGDEVFVVSPSGSVGWQAPVEHPTDAERVSLDAGQGDADSGHASPGSTVGAVGNNSSVRDQRASAAATDIRSRDEPSPVWNRPFGHYIEVGLEQVGLAGAVDAVLPVWMDEKDLPALATLVGTLGAWALLEAWWRAGDAVALPPGRE